MGFPTRNCCRPVCRPDCEVPFDIKYKLDFDKLLHPSPGYAMKGETRYYDSVWNNDIGSMKKGNLTVVNEIEDGSDAPYEFKNIPFQISYSDTAGEFTGDNFSVNLNLSKQYANDVQAQTTTESYTIQVGSDVISGVNIIKSTWVYDEDQETYYLNYERDFSISFNNKLVYYNPTDPSNNTILGTPHYIIRGEHETHYYLGDIHIYAFQSSPVNSISFSFSINYSDIDSSHSEAGVNTDNIVTLSKIILTKPDRILNTLSYQDYINITNGEDSTFLDLSDVNRKNFYDAEGCASPKPCYQRCFPPIGIKFTGFKNSGLMTIPGDFLNIDGEDVVMNHEFLENLPGNISGSETRLPDLNTIAQLYYASGSDYVRWRNGCKQVKLDWSEAKKTLKAVRGDCNEITFENLKPVTVMTNLQAYYDWREFSAEKSYTDSCTYDLTENKVKCKIRQGFNGFNELVRESENTNVFYNTGLFNHRLLLAYYISEQNRQTMSSLSLYNFHYPPPLSEFKYSVIEPFSFFGYKWMSDGTWSKPETPVIKTDDEINLNLFTITDIKLSVFPGIIAPIIVTQSYYNETLKFFFPRAPSEILGENTIPEQGSNYVKSIEILSADATVEVTTGTTGDAWDDSIVHILNVTNIKSEIGALSTIKFRLTDIFGAKSDGVIRLETVDSSEINGEYALDRRERTTPYNYGVNEDYDCICELSCKMPGSYGGDIKLYYVHDGKRVKLSDLIGKTATSFPFQKRYQEVDGVQLLMNQWHSWDGMEQDAIQATFVALNEDDCQNDFYASAFEDEYRTTTITTTNLTTGQTSTRKYICSQDVDYIELVLDQKQLVLYEESAVWDFEYTGAIWVDQGRHSIILKPEYSPKECLEYSNNEVYKGSGDFITYTDVTTGENTHKIIDFTATPVLPYTMEDWFNPLKSCCVTLDQFTVRDKPNNPPPGYTGHDNTLVETHSWMNYRRINFGIPIEDRPSEPYPAFLYSYCGEDCIRIIDVNSIPDYAVGDNQGPHLIIVGLKLAGIIVHYRDGSRRIKDTLDYCDRLLKLNSTISTDNNNGN